MVEEEKKINLLTSNFQSYSAQTHVDKSTEVLLLQQVEDNPPTPQKKQVHLPTGPTHSSKHTTGAT